MRIPVSRVQLEPELPPSGTKALPCANLEEEKEREL